MAKVLRIRKTDYPRTYVLLKGKKCYYLLFWLEHGKDGSLYIWFDDNPDSSWEVSATHNAFSQQVLSRTEVRGLSFVFLAIYSHFYWVKF